MLYKKMKLFFMMRDSRIKKLPETIIVSGDKSTLIMHPVFGEYYNQAPHDIFLRGAVSE